MKKTNHITKLMIISVFVAAMGVSPAVFGYGDSPPQAEQTGNKQYSEDARITKTIKTDILEDSTMKGPQVSVETMQGNVQLSGSVDSRSSAAKAVEIAKNVQGVVSVKDDLVIR